MQSHGQWLRKHGHRRQRPDPPQTPNIAARRASQEQQEHAVQREWKPQKQIVATANADTRELTANKIYENKKPKHRNRN